jgi:hypothetical protein
MKMICAPPRSHPLPRRALALVTWLVHYAVALRVYPAPDAKGEREGQNPQQADSQGWKEPVAR